MISSIPNDTLVLCRTSPNQTAATFFIARCDRQTLTHQAAVRDEDRRRLSWGAALLMGFRLKLPVRQEREHVQFEIWRSLPRQESRLLRALAHVESPSGRGTQFKLHRQFLPVVSEALSGLGIDIDT